MAGAFFMEILDGTVIAPAAPHIAADLGVAAGRRSTSRSPAYVLTLAVLIPISGWLADRFGARRVFAAAIARVHPRLGGLRRSPPNLPMLTATRVLQGVGGAMMVPVGRLVVLRTTAKSDLVTGHRLPDLAGARRARARPGAGRRAQHVRLLAVDLPDQRAARAGRRCCWPAGWCPTCAPSAPARLDGAASR